ncbi:MAG: AraC family transcriptional regulator [Rhodospirillaceae bacterium]|nr:AraC family transcriptional regulator [Rhodospirillaceae bacterium]
MDASGAGHAPAGLVETAAAGDLLGRTLHSVRLTGALFFLVDATSPWCVDVPPAGSYADIILPGASHVMSYHVIVEGHGWASVPGIAPVPFGPGDVILFPQGDAYVMESAPGTPPEFDREGMLGFFRALAAGALPFVVTEGGGEAPPARVICGFLGCAARVFNPILSSLPRLLRLERAGADLADGSAGGRGDLLHRLIDLTLEEAQAGRAGGGSVHLRLAELLFIEVLRQYALSPAPKPPGWLAGLQDAPVARALAVLHDRPAEAWTVGRLARAAGLSRSALASRFAERVGCPPMQYLAQWRMQMAATALADGGPSMAEIAHAVGYGSEAAFSRGFKRIVGVTPETWRQGAGR